MLLQKVTFHQPVKKCPVLYGTVFERHVCTGLLMFIAVLKTACHFSLLSDTVIQFMPLQTTSLRSTSILSPLLTPSLLPAVSPPKPFMRLFSPHTCYMPYLSHTASFDTPSTTVRCAEQIMQLFVTQFSAIPSFFRPLRSFLSTLFSDILGLCSTKFHTQTKDKRQERIH